MFLPIFLHFFSLEIVDLVLSHTVYCFTTMAVVVSVFVAASAFVFAK
jgi:hypothetical protein